MCEEHAVDEFETRHHLAFGLQGPLLKGSGRSSPEGQIQKPLEVPGLRAENESPRSRDALRIWLFKPFYSNHSISTVLIQLDVQTDLFNPFYLNHSISTVLFKPHYLNLYIQIVLSKPFYFTV